MYLWPQADFVSVPTRSIPILSKVMPIIGRGIRRAGAGLLRACECRPVRQGITVDTQDNQSLDTWLCKGHGAPRVQPGFVFGVPPQTELQ